MRTIKIILCMTVVAFMALTTGAAATYTTYFDEAAFVSALAPGYYLEDFDTVSFGWEGYSQSYSGGDGYAYTISARHGLYGGPQDMSTYRSKDPLTITFTGDTVYAVGGLFFPSDAYGNDTAGHRYKIYVSINNGPRIELDYSTLGRQFLGFISDTPITTMTIDTNRSNNYWPTMDHFYDAEAPLPPSLLLLGSGLVGLVLLRFRKRSKSKV